MTDEQIATMLRNQFAQSRKMLDIREKYYNEFSKILSQKADYENLSAGKRVI